MGIFQTPEVAGNISFSSVTYLSNAQNGHIGAWVTDIFLFFSSDPMF